MRHGRAMDECILRYSMRRIGSAHAWAQRASHVHVMTDLVISDVCGLWLVRLVG